MSVENRLHELSIKLPPPPKPAGNYLPFIRTGNLVFLAGTLCMENGKVAYTGKVGDIHTVEAAYRAARLCALNSIAVLQEAAGSLDNVAQIVSVAGFVNALPDFSESPQVLNGASDLFAEVFGQQGLHARTAISVSGLPRDSTVEIQVIAALHG